MSIINPSVSLSLLDIAPVWAKLERIDSKGSYDFLVNPEEIVWSHQAEYSSLPVLYTAQPLVSYKSSVSSLSLPKVLFWTKANSGDLSTVLKSLKDMTKPPVAGQEPPLVKLSWGDLNEPRLYLSRFNYREKQWRSGRVTQAEGSMDLVIAPEPPKAQIQAIPKGQSNGSVNSSAKPTKLTDRERQEYAKKLQNKLNIDKQLKAKYQYTKVTSVKVEPDGSVMVVFDGGLNRVGGSLESFLGNDVKPGHKGLGV